jgi:hypothetical protein
VPTVTFVGGFNSPFVQAAGSNCGTTLDVGASCQVNISFTPTAVQAYSGSVNVAATGATITPASAPLAGAGVATAATVSISPNPMTITLLSPVATPLDPGTLSLTGLVALTNTAAAGGASVAVSGVTVTNGSGTGTFAHDSFSGPDNCTGTSLAPGASCTVSVRYTVSANANRGGSHTGTIRFTDNASGSPQVGQLIGVPTP